MQLPVLDKEGNNTGRSAELADEVFGIQPNDHVIYLSVRQHMANKRQGTHKAKERAEIKGSTRKIKRQKGTGTARAGSLKSPVFRGGGRAFGPRPRNYSFKLNKKVKNLARKSALSYKSIEEAVYVLEDFNFEAPKTRDMINLIKGLDLSAKKTLLVLGEANDNVRRSAGSLRKVNVITADMLSTYDIVDADALVLTEGSIEKVTALNTKYNHNAKVLSSDEKNEIRERISA